MSYKEVIKITEKRFKISYDDGLIRLVKDNITKNNLDIIDCCSALNELSKENKQLKHLLKHKEQYIHQLQKEPKLYDVLAYAYETLNVIEEYEKENKELKEEVENLIEDLGDACNYIEEKNKEIKKLNETINNLITKDKR